MPELPRLDQLTRLLAVRIRSSPVTCTVKSTEPVVEGIAVNTDTGEKSIQLSGNAADVVVEALVSVIVPMGISL